MHLEGARRDEMHAHARTLLGSLAVASWSVISDWEASRINVAAVCDAYRLCISVSVLMSCTQMDTSSHCEFEHGLFKA